MVVPGIGMVSRLRMRMQSNAAGSSGRGMERIRAASSRGWGGPLRGPRPSGVREALVDRHSPTAAQCLPLAL